MTPKRPEQTDLIAALQAGEPQALDRFYREHAPQVLAWVIRLGGHRLDSEDTAHEVFMVALRRLGSFRGESALTTWLYGITRNVVNNARRKAALRRFVGMDDIPEPIAATPGADEHLDQMRQRQRVQVALQRLNQRQREVLVLTDLEGRSAPEVSEMIGVPVGTVYSRLHHARRAFSKALTAVGQDSSERLGRSPLGKVIGA
jgi:RNA polymerase sigma-70 factor (ECF subfamily)